MKIRKSPASTQPVLVVGATGQLGTRVVNLLAAARRPVRALVRPSSQHEHLRQPGVELVTGDLHDPASLAAACQGAGAVVATANAVAPTHGSSFASVEDRGYAALIDACRQQGCGRFVFMSVAVTPFDARIPLFVAKRRIEARLVASGLEHSILRAAPFMDDWFALVGSRLVARGDEAALIDRRWPFLQRFMRMVGGLVERKGLALVPGPADNRHDFITVQDVARCLVACIDNPAAHNTTLAVGGPQDLSWTEVAALFAQVLGRPVHVVSTPAAVFAAQRLLMRPFSQAASNIMALNWMAAQPLPPLGTADAEALGVTLTRAEDFLRAQAALPPRADEGP